MEVMTSHFQQTDFNFNSRLSPPITDHDQFNDRFTEDLENKLKLSDGEEDEELVINGGDDYEEGDGEDFSFAFVNQDGSPISADDAFQNGQIRSIFPVFGRDLSDLILAGDDVSGFGDSKSLPIKRVFVESGAATSTATTPKPAGPFCEWRGKTVQEASPDRCKKSNSTGFSKLRRIREIVLKSNSDGKDAFVFLNNTGGDTATAITNGGEIKKEKIMRKKKEETTPLSAYMKSKAKENDKRKSYLPYKQVGFFTNVNGLSRNVHPF
jgi:hypothetical protein